ncbi:hypothetical protein Tco_1188263 [Tanacetum coccineum]
MNNRREHHIRAYLSPIEDTRAWNVLRDSTARVAEESWTTCVFSDAALRTSLLYQRRAGQPGPLRVVTALASTIGFGIVLLGSVFNHEE